jgi:hypothetical protein
MSATGDKPMVRDMEAGECLVGAMDGMPFFQSHDITYQWLF